MLDWHACWGLHLAYDRISWRVYQDNVSRRTITNLANCGTSTGSPVTAHAAWRLAGRWLRTLAVAGSSCQTILLEEAEDVIVGRGVSVLVVQAVACTHDNVDLKRRGVGKVLLGSLRDARIASRSGKTVSTTEWNIVLTGDDQGGTLEHVLCAGSTSNGEQLADGHRLSSHSRVLQEVWIEISWSKEVRLNATRVGWSDVSIDVARERGILVRLDEVSTQQEVGKESTVLRETSEANAIRDVGVPDEGPNR